MLYLGIDESRRCECIGDMIVCAVVVPQTDFKGLVSLGIKDSKRMGKAKVRFLGDLLRRKYKHNLVKIKASRISVGSTIVENEIEEIMKIVEKQYDKVDKIIIDSVVNNTKPLSSYSDGFEKYKKKLINKCHADNKYIPVMVASIIAKYYAIKETEDLDKKYDVGSCLATDPKTLQYIINNLDNKEGIIRTMCVIYKRLSDKKIADKVIKMIEEGEEIINTKEMIR